jgi:purine-binding chemotaxis protein CheW
VRVKGPEAFLTLRLDDTRLGLPLSRVKEIFEPESVTRVPGAARSVQGVINLRGSVVPVVDLASALGLREPATSPPRCVVLLEADIAGERTLVGVTSDSVEEVVELAPEDIGPVPAFGTGVAVDGLVGLARSKAGFVLLLDVERALAATVPGTTVEAPQDAA